MSTTYQYYREIYDVNGIYNYICATLPAITSISYNAGTITTYWPSSLSPNNLITLNGLISSYSNPQVTITNNNFRQVSIGNSSSSLLTANSIFTGYFEDVSNYSSIVITLYSDQTSATNGLILQFSTDGINIDNTQLFTVPSNGFSCSSIVFSQYVRIMYVNGTTDQTVFRLESIYHYYKTPSSSIPLTQSSISSTQEASLCRSVLSGINLTGQYINVPVNYLGGLSLDVQNTSFGQLTSESLFPLVQNDFVYAINQETCISSSNNIGSITQSNNVALINSGANSNSSALLTSKKSVRCRVGQGIRIMISPTFGAPTLGNIQLAGVGSPTDGCFFGYNGATFGICRRAFGSNYWTPQSSWNIDPMLGSGPSGQTLNPQFGNVYMILYQGVGYGAIQFFIEETYSGNFSPVHVIQYANTSTSTSMQMPYLNCYAQSSNTTNTTNVPLTISSYSAFVEGTPSFNGPKFAVANYKALNTAIYTPVLSIKNLTTFQTKTNHISVYMRNIAASSDSRAAIFSLVKNPTLTGASFVNVNSNTSVVQYDTSASSLSGGTTIWNWCMAVGSALNQIFLQYELNMEPGDIFCCAISIPTSQNTNICCTLNWVEDC